MDEDKYIEQYVEFYYRIDAKLKGRGTLKPDPVIIGEILDQVGKSIRQDKISESRKTGYGESGTSGLPPPSDKQLAFISDLGGDPTSVHDIEAASKLIETLRKKH